VGARTARRWCQSLNDATALVTGCRSVDCIKTPTIAMRILRSRVESTKNSRRSNGAHRQPPSVVGPNEHRSYLWRSTSTDLLRNSAHGCGFAPLGCKPWRSVSRRASYPQQRPVICNQFCHRTRPCRWQAGRCSAGRPSQTRSRRNRRIRHPRFSWIHEGRPESILLESHSRGPGPCRNLIAISPQPVSRNESYG